MKGIYCFIFLSFLGNYFLLSSCTKEENSPTPKFENKQVQKVSSMPENYLSKGVNEKDCMNLEGKEITIELWNPFPSRFFKGSIIINGEEIYFGEFPIKSQSISIDHNLENLGFNYLIFYSDTFQFNWANAIIRVHSGPAFKEFNIKSDYINSDGIHLVVKSGNIDCESLVPNDSLLGNLTFAIKYDPNCGPEIEVRVNDIGTKIISRYYLTPDIPTCGSNGCANFVIPAGDYNWTASCPGKTWGPTQVAVVQNLCKTVFLN